MSMLEIHRSALMEIIVPYHHFLTQQSKYRKKLFGFVEGKDDPAYYQTHIAPLINDEWDIVLIEAGAPKGNRTRVLSLLDTIDWNRFSPMQTVFFIDRDLSDFFPDLNVEKDNLYMTDYYSIENSIVSVYTLKRTLRELYNVNLFEEEFSIVQKLFNEGLIILCSVIEKISCYYIALRKLGKTPSFADIDIGELCKVNNCKVTVKPDETVIEHLREKWHFNSDEIDLSQIIIEYSHYNQNLRCVRGKYLMWYFVKFINCFRGCCYDHIPRMDKPITGVRDLSESYAIVDLSARSKTPESLKHFIANTYQQYIYENS